MLVTDFQTEALNLTNSQTSSLDFFTSLRILLLHSNQIPHKIAKKLVTITKYPTS